MPLRELHTTVHCWLVSRGIPCTTIAADVAADAALTARLEAVGITPGDTRTIPS